MRILCYILHDWGDWEEHCSGVIVETNYKTGESMQMGIFYYQFRVCNRCKLKQFKRTEVSSHNPFKKVIQKIEEKFIE